MRRFWAWTGAALAILLAAMALTLPTRLGFALWHYNAAFLVALVAAGAAWPFLKHRRFATLTMAGTGLVATVTGFAMLYTVEFSFKEWLTWWHGATSFAFMLAFLAHWLHNNARLLAFAKRLLGRDRWVGWRAAGAWVVVLFAGAWTWTSGPRAAFTPESYLYHSSLAVLAGVAFAYGWWLAYRAPKMRALLNQTRHRNRARGLVDTGLFLSNWGALLTGFALLYFAEFLRSGDLKYVSKWWHTATSVMLLAFVALHVGFNAHLLRAHAKRVSGDQPKRSDHMDSNRPS